MARSPRAWVEGAIYHVFARGSNRQAIFLNEGDYIEFDMLLAAAIRKHRLDTFGWSLMPNHWHGIFRCPPGGLSEFMQRLNQRYALRFDRRWGRTAHVFDNRFGAVLQKTGEQFRTTVRYVARNPVEAGLCSSPFDARWTSFPATIGLVLAPEYLRVGEILGHFGHDPADARERFIAFVLGTPDESGGVSVRLVEAPSAPTAA
ncbi:MAG: transposase [Gaiella sp.]|nr:transposase [Gaiella sp.]